MYDNINKISTYLAQQIILMPKNVTKHVVRKHPKIWEVFDNTDTVVLHSWLMCGYMMAWCFSIAVEVTAHMALDATVLRAGAAIKAHVHAHMPIAAELAINMAKWKMNAKLKLPAKVCTR